MRIYGIIGWPLGHSFSKPYFEGKFARLGLDDRRYYNLPIENIAELSEILAEYPELAGFNVTIPYKKDIIGRLDEISPEAAEIGAVNCVKIENEKLKGYNTDAYGFRAGLEKLIAAERPAALVLGTGGASAAVCYVLSQLGVKFLNVSRTKKLNNLTYGELTPAVMESHPLIVNTTPLGTWPDTEEKPDIPYDSIGPEHFLYDLVYNPPVTAFLAEGVKRGAKTLNGETMLHAQAERSWEIWEFKNLGIERGIHF